MSISPSSSAHAARAALAARLRDLRLDANLTGQQLSALCGWDAAKTSRIERVRVPPSDEDIRAWCRACDVADQAPDLVAASRTADSMYLQWRRTHRTGMRLAQDATVPLYERTRLFRVYCSTVIPGLVQTPAYAAALMSSITRFQGTPDDVTDAVAARMARSRMVLGGEHRCALIVEESVLHYRVGDPGVMAGQLGHLLTVMTQPSVAIGVIPATAERRMWPLEAFNIYDDEQVFVELLTAAVTISSPREIADYERAFTDLSQMAVYGGAARTLIAGAITAIDESDRNFPQTR